jgi:hypothetical protein
VTCAVRRVPERRIEDASRRVRTTDGNARSAVRKTGRSVARRFRRSQTVSAGQARAFDHLAKMRVAGSNPVVRSRDVQARGPLRRASDVSDASSASEVREESARF